MKRAHEVALADFHNATGELFGRTLAVDWVAPDSVELRNGRLTIRGTPHYLRASTRGCSIRAPHGLLDSFTSLADTSETIVPSAYGATGAAVRSLRDVGKLAAPSDDDRIYSFANRYGGLQIFYELGDNVDGPDTEHIEYCDVWRYFAGVMRSLQRIAADLYRGGSGLSADWHLINTVPPVMRKTARKSRPGRLNAFPQGDEQNWIALAHFVGKVSQQNRVMFGHLVNTLLGLGYVRPWLTWSDASRGVVHPKIAYSSRSLLSQLALQLCVRLAKVDDFLVCIHCQKSYSRVVRAPKVGQRNFCPQCRGKGVPQAYALRDFRQRQRLGAAD
jgi:hypothetical protein